MNFGTYAIIFSTWSVVGVAVPILIIAVCERKNIYLSDRFICIMLTLGGPFWWIIVGLFRFLDSITQDS